MKQIKILENPFPRRDLGEGRNYGLGFSLVKKVNEDKYIPLIPLTACKDYLNDIAHSEEYNSIHGSIYGFSYEHSNYFENDNTHGYLIVSPVHFNGGGEWDDFEYAKSLLFKNKLGLLRVLRYFEDKLNIKRTEVFETVDYYGVKVLMFKFDRFWMKETILISLYTLLIRYYFNYTDKNVSRKRLFNHKPFIYEDEYTFSDSVRKKVIYNFKKLAHFKTNNYIVAQNFTTMNQIHNHGIVEGIENIINI